MKENDKVKALQKLGEILAEIGWCIAIPGGDDKVDHLLVGEKETIIEISERVGEEYEILERLGLDS